MNIKDNSLSDYKITLSWINIYCRSSPPEVFCNKDALKNLAKFPGKQLCWSLFLNKVAGETPIQVFSCEFC